MEKVYRLVCNIQRHVLGGSLKVTFLLFGGFLIRFCTLYSFYVSSAVSQKSVKN